MRSPALDPNLGAALTADLRSLIPICFVLSGLSLVMAGHSYWRRGYWLRRDAGLNIFKADSLRLMQSPWLGLGGGFSLAALGFGMISPAGLVLPATGMFIAIVGLLVVLQSLRVAAAGGFGTVDQEVLVELRADRRASQYLALDSEGALLHHAEEATRELRYYQSNWSSFSAIEQQLLTEFRETDETVASALLLLADLLDVGSIQAAAQLARNLRSSAAREIGLFWILQAAVHSRSGAPRKAISDARRAYTLLNDPPDWLREWIAQSPRGGTSFSLSQEARAYVLMGILDEESLARERALC
jgi:hypothetical protein